MKARTVCILLAAFATEMLVSSPVLAQGSGLFVSADWLNWKARRRDMDFVIVDPNTDPFVEGEQINADYDRDNGARVVLGYHLDNCWDFAVEYQTYDTSDRVSVTQPAGGSLWGTRLHPDSVIGDRFSTSAGASATLDYDVLDFTLSRRFLLGCPQHVNLTLFGGFRYAMIDQTLDITYVDSVNSRTVDVTNPIKLDAYGMRAGGQLDWNVWGCWSMFGRGAFSTLAARVNANYRETDVTGAGTTTRFNVSETYYQAVPGIETAVGIAYQRNNWELGFGYEMALWGNVAERRDFGDDIDEQKFSYPSSDLILDGFFLQLAYNR